MGRPNGKLKDAVANCIDCIDANRTSSANVGAAARRGSNSGLFSRTMPRHFGSHETTRRRPSEILDAHTVFG